MDGDFSSRKIVAMYGCNSFSIDAVINGSRFFVLKIIWIRMDDRDWDMEYPRLPDYFAPSALSYCEILFLPGPLAQAFTLRAFGALTALLTQSTQLKPFSVLRNFYLPSKAFANMTRHCLGRVRLTVGDEHSSRRGWQSFKPANNFFPIRMSRKAANLFYLTAYRNPLSQNFYLLFAISDAATERPGSLIPDKHHGCIFIRQ